MNKTIQRSLYSLIPVVFCLLIVFSGGVTAWNAPDAAEYESIARNFMNCGVLESPDTVVARRTPLLPFLLGVIGLITGLKYAYIVLNAASIFVIAFLTLRLAEEFKLRYAKWAVVFLTFSSGLMATGSAPLSEVPYLALLYGALDAFYRKNWWLSGLLLGLGTLMRPIGVLLPFLAAAVMLLPRPDWKSARMALLLLFFSLIPVTAWQMRNYARYGHFKLTSVSGMNALEFKIGSYLSWKENRPFRTVTDELNNMIPASPDAFELDRRRSELAKRLLKENFFGFCLYAPCNLIYFFMPGTTALLERLQLTQGNRGTYDLLARKGVSAAARYYFDTVRQPLLVIGIFAITLPVLLVLYGVSAWGWCRLLRQKSTRLPAVELLLFVLYFAVLPIGNLDWRFRLPVLPLMILLALYALTPKEELRASE